MSSACWSSWRNFLKYIFWLCENQKSVNFFEKLCCFKNCCWQLFSTVQYIFHVFIINIVFEGFPAQLLLLFLVVLNFTYKKISTAPTVYSHNKKVTNKTVLHKQLKFKVAIAVLVLQYLHYSSLPLELDPNKKQ